MILFGGELLVERIAVEDVEDLGDARFAGAFATAGFFAFGTAERTEEIRINLGVGKLDGPKAFGVIFEFRGRACGVGISVEENFSHEALGIIARVKAVFVLVGGERFAGALIGGGLKDGAHERFEIVSFLDEMPSGGGEKFLVAGGVGHAQIVDVFDQADSEEICPDAIDDRAGEIRIFRRSEPVGERFAAVTGVVGWERFSVERRGSLRFAAEWLNQIAGSSGENDALAVGRAVLGADAREEIGHLIILVVGPLLHG